MNQQSSDIISQAVDKTSNDLILFFAIAAACMLILMIPLYQSYLRGNREKRKSQLDREAIQAKREAQLISVIQHNTDVNSQLKALLETNNTYNKDKLNELGDKIDTHNDKLVEVHTMLKTRSCLMMDRR